jgi:hypothetical protein
MFDVNVTSVQDGRKCVGKNNRRRRREFLTKQALFIVVFMVKDGQ